MPLELLQIIITSIKYKCQRTIQASLLAPPLRSWCQLFHSRTQYQRGWSCAPADTSAATTARAATACKVVTRAPATARRSAPSWKGRATAAPPPTASSGAPSKVRSRCSVICNPISTFLGVVGMQGNVGFVPAYQPPVAPLATAPPSGVEPMRCRLYMCVGR